MKCFLKSNVSFLDGYWLYREDPNSELNQYQTGKKLSPLSAKRLVEEPLNISDTSLSYYVLDL